MNDLNKTTKEFFSIIIFGLVLLIICLSIGFYLEQ